MSQELRCVTCGGVMNEVRGEVATIGWCPSCGALVERWPKWDERGMASGTRDEWWAPSARADLAEAIALLREVRAEFVDDDEDLAEGIDALLARHPGPEE